MTFINLHMYTEREKPSMKLDCVRGHREDVLISILLLAVVDVPAPRT